MRSNTFPCSRTADWQKPVAKRHVSAIQPGHMRWSRPRPRAIGATNCATHTATKICARQLQLRLRLRESLRGQKPAGAGLGLFQIRPSEGLSNESAHLRPLLQGKQIPLESLARARGVQMPGHCCILLGGSLPRRRSFVETRTTTSSQDSLSQSPDPA